VRYHNTLIQKVKTLVNGRLEDNTTSKLCRKVTEFHIEAVVAEDYSQEILQQHIGYQLQRKLWDAINDWSMKWRLSSELMYDFEGNKYNMGEEDDDSRTTMSSKRNYYKAFDKKATLREKMETAAQKEQEKQAAVVNKYRSWEGGEQRQ